MDSKEKNNHLKLENLPKLNKEAEKLSEKDFKENIDLIKTLGGVVISNNEEITKADFQKAINRLMSNSSVKPVLLNIKQINELWKSSSKIAKEIPPLNELPEGYTDEQINSIREKISCEKDSENNDGEKTVNTNERIKKKLFIKGFLNRKWKSIFTVSLLILILFSSFYYFWNKYKSHEYVAKIFYSSDRNHNELLIKYSLEKESNITLEKEYDMKFGKNDYTGIFLNGKKLKFEIKSKNVDMISVTLEIWKDDEKIFVEYVSGNNEEGEKTIRFKDE